jgi:hypothetical protein
MRCGDAARLCLKPLDGLPQGVKRLFGLRAVRLVYTRVFTASICQELATAITEEPRDISAAEQAPLVR